MKCQAGCDKEAVRDPAMPNMLHGVVCKFHWYVWKAENNRSFTVLDSDDFTRVEVLEEAEGREC